MDWMALVKAILFTTPVAAAFFCLAMMINSILDIGNEHPPKPDTDTVKKDQT